MNVQWKILGEVGLSALHALMIGGSFVAVVVGVYLLILPQRVWALNRYLSTWFAPGTLTDPLDAPRYIERTVYRHHREVGAALLLGTLYSLYMLMFHYNPKAALATLGHGLNPNIAAWLLESMVFILIVGSVFALAISLVLIVRPSLLRSLESWANRWCNTDKVVKPLDAMINTPDEVIMRHPRITAAIFILGGLYVLTSFWLGRL